MNVPKATINANDVGSGTTPNAAGSFPKILTSSDVFYTNRPICPGVAKVSADSYSSLTFKLFADGSLKHTQTVTNANIFRLPGGYQAKSFEIQLEGTDTINEVCVYESPQEIT